MRKSIRILLIFIVVLVLVAAFYGVFSLRPVPETITYGMSFNTLYARELGLDPRETYLAILNDLGVRHLRLAAHWPLIEPEDDKFNFDETDFQVEQAKKSGADIILGVGRRLPRWPECHVPDWAQGLPWEDQKKEIKEQITEVINRYKDQEHILYWQVENEPFLTVFANEQCGDLDKEFLKEEIALVKNLDPTRPVLVTDSGNLGTWAGAYKAGDAFGTSVYVFLWNPDIGPFKSLLPPSYYRVKQNLMRILFGDKPVFLIELSAEPWLLMPVVETDIETQLSRMNTDKFNKILQFARETRLDRQYLWGAEWWYWLSLQGQDAFWNKGKELFAQSGDEY